MNRRGFLLSLGAALATPAIVPYANLMQVKAFTAADVHRIDAVMRLRALTPEEFEIIVQRRLSEHARKWWDKEVYSILSTGQYSDGTAFGSQALVDSYARAAVI